VKTTCLNRDSATPSGWKFTSARTGGIAAAQPPANIWQPSGLTTERAADPAIGRVLYQIAGKFAHREAVEEFSRRMNDNNTPRRRFRFIPHREAVTEISRGLSVATPPENDNSLFRTPEGCQRETTIRPTFLSLRGHIASSTKDRRRPNSYLPFTFPTAT
jgi:hypothetical protein